MRHLFTFGGAVTRAQYIGWGFGLAALKYVLEATYVWFITGKIWPLTAFLSPFASVRLEALGRTSTAEFAMVGMMLLSLPFAWIGLTMSVRRAANGFWSPWLGVGFLVPILNYVVIAALCFRPEREDDPSPHEVERQAPTLVQAATTLPIGVAIMLAMVGISVHLLGEYGWSVFVATPFVIGAISGFIVNRKQPTSALATAAVATLNIVLGGLTCLLFGLEGIICISMAALPAVIACVPGALVGQFIAISTFHKGGGARAVAMVVCMLPLLAGVEASVDKVALREVATTVEIDAPPMEVWDKVIHFSELDPPNDWVFATGIAYPMRAKLEGRGVGAVRYCEFSTGPFVEPITAWEPGKRLAFDVESQPTPMKEWSPYRHVHPPHLDGYFQSKRGEFRLVDLGNGRTRLEGSTWYELDLAPYAYWTLLSDQLLHHIHRRVLDHVKKESEQR